MDEILQIDDREYRKTGSPPLFRVPINELRDLHFADVPFYSTVEVENLPSGESSYELSINAVHAGGPHNECFFFNFHVNFWQTGGPDDSGAIAACTRKLRHIKRQFREFTESGVLDDGGDFGPLNHFNGKWFSGVLYSANFTRENNPRLADLVQPFVKCFERLIATPDRLLFLCHASEDKAFVERLAAYLDTREVSIWYDKREIKVGESIVVRINEGLEAASHLVVILSKASVSKQWVQKELSAALMKHLKDRSIAIIPVLLESCAIPALLADLKYADCRSENEDGFRELVLCPTNK